MARARQLTLQELAELSARLAKPFADRREILAGAGLDEASWASTKEGMTIWMTARLRAGDRGVVDVYRAAFEGRPVPQASATPPPDVLAPRSPEPVAAKPASPDIPSYLRVPQHAENALLREPALPVAPVMSPPAQAATPSAPMASPAGPAPFRMAPVPLSTLPLSSPAHRPGQVETDEMDMSTFREPAIPFARAEPADEARRSEQRRADEALAQAERDQASPDAVAARKLAETDRAVIERMQQSFGGGALGATRPADASDLRKPLPFPATPNAQGSAAPPKPEVAPAPSKPEVGRPPPPGVVPPFRQVSLPQDSPHPRVNKAPAALVETSHLAEGSAPPEAKPFVQGGPRHPPTMHLPAPLPQQSGHTRMGSAGRRPSMPFQRGAAPTGPLPPGWTLQRYAVLCIDLHASGLDEAEVLRSHAISTDERRALDAHWEHRMMVEPALRAEWKAHADRREAELRAKPRTPR
jgi:hypothetical protein